jgi:alginate O-acetyltransferase complex protein AlgI
MLFNSFEYFVLLIATVILYWALPNQGIRKAVLLVASMIFYLSWNAPFILLLLALCFLNWFCSLRESITGKPMFTHFAVITTLVVLGYFKYSNFILANLSAFAESIGVQMDAPKLSIILPLGISFYCFQLIAYTIDAREKKFPVERNPFDVFLFILYFPQLIAGPICHRNELMPQLNEKKSFLSKYIYEGLALMGIGLMLKVAFADGIAPFVDLVFANHSQYLPAQKLQAVVGYSIQILGDFWGYSTMAVGSARMFGIEIPINFDLPYASRSLQEFWRRWHITLSLWLRDYLYIRLGGSRLGEFNTYRNLLITMVLGGLWHGANWTFLVWGAIHGGVLAVERYLTSLQSSNLSPKSSGYFVSLMKWSYTMFVVVLAWVYFRAANVSDANQIIYSLFSVTSNFGSFAWDDPSLVLILCFVPVHVLLHFEIKKILAGQRERLACASLAVALIFLSIVFSDNDVQKFIYFEF